MLLLKVLQSDQAAKNVTFECLYRFEHCRIARCKLQCNVEINVAASFLSL